MKSMGLFRKKTTEDKKEEKKLVKEELPKKSMKDLYEEAKITEVKEGKKETKARKYGNAYKILLEPLVTEKATILGSDNKYVFRIAKQANKIEVAKAVEEVYGVKPIGVNVIKNRGKKVRYGKTKGRKKDWKKAIITLPKGTSIKVYEGV